MLWKSHTYYTYYQQNYLQKIKIRIIIVTKISHLSSSWRYEVCTETDDKRWRNMRRFPIKFEIPTNTVLKIYSVLYWKSAQKCRFEFLKRVAKTSALSKNCSTNTVNVKVITHLLNNFVSAHGWERMAFIRTRQVRFLAFAFCRGALSFACANCTAIADMNGILSSMLSGCLNETQLW